MENRAGPGGAPRTVATAAARLKDCAPLKSVHHYRRFPERAGRVRGYLEAAGSFTAADHLVRVLDGKQLKTAEALLLRNAVAALHDEAARNPTASAAARQGGSAEQTRKRAGTAYGRCAALLAELSARHAPLVDGLQAARNLEDSLGWEWSPESLPPTAGRDRAVREGLPGLLEHLEESRKALERSTSVLGKALRPGSACQDLSAETARACEDLVRLRSALEAYQEGLAEACVALWKRAVKAARKEFTGAVDHYDREFALMSHTFKATALVLGAAGTAASVLCPPVAAVAIGVAAAGVVGPAAALRKRAGQETADPDRVVELLRNKAVPVSRLKKRAKAAGNGGREEARAVAGKAGELLDTGNEGFGAVSNLLTAGGAHAEVAAAAAVLAESTVVLASTPAGAAIGHLGLLRDAAASTVRTTVPVGGAAERERLPADARTVRKTAKTAGRSAPRPGARTVGSDSAGRMVTAVNGSDYVFDPDTGRSTPLAGPVRVPDRCTVTYPYSIWNQLTEQSFPARADFVLCRGGGAARQDGAHPMVIETVTVSLVDVTGGLRVLDLARLGRDATGERCLVKTGAGGAVAVLEPFRYVPPAVDAVQAYALDRPELLLDTGTPYYTAGVALLHEGPPRWEVQQVSANLPWVEAGPFEGWLAAAKAEADCRGEQFTRRDRAYDDPRN
ncbi:hypothetical protein [Streptomyces sp. NPDC086023]|uniref:hypothetical protein n=1 Tax=Streptomyces sp. NPDC086023 TaxID=3365746 RepID=UPI0037CF11CB